MQSELVLDDASPLNFGRQPVGRFATIRRVITNKGGLHINFLVKHANTGEGRCGFMGTRACVCVWLCVAVCGCVWLCVCGCVGLTAKSRYQVCLHNLTLVPSNLELRCQSSLCSELSTPACSSAL